MNTDVFKNVLGEKECEFLNKTPNLMLVGYGGSHAYGTNIATSDVDVRGIYMNPVDEILGIKADSEQRVDGQTDTTVYSFKKVMKLLQNCNPNVIEILGLRPQDYLYVSDPAKLLLDNKQLFLSKQAVKTFGGYALSQLNRLINKSGRSKSEITANEVRSMDKMLIKFGDRYQHYAASGSKVTVRPADLGDDPCEDDRLYFDMNLKNLPISTVIQIFNEIVAIDKDYRSSSRNEKAIEHNKLNKHMMHLIRLYMMGVDILDKGEIVTYREAEHDLLMSIRNGDYLEADGVTPTAEFKDLLDEYKNKFDNAALHSPLPDKPDFDKINKLAMDITSMYLSEMK